MDHFTLTHVSNTTNYVIRNQVKEIALITSDNVNNINIITHETFVIVSY